MLYSEKGVVYQTKKGALDKALALPTPAYAQETAYQKTS